MNKLHQISEELNTQDNQFTSNPIFMVEEEVVVYGMDPDYCEDTVWYSVHDYHEADEQEARELDEQYEENYEVPKDWFLTGKYSYWKAIQPFFTEKAAQNYIDNNKHKNLRIYVDSAYRNPQWQLITNYLKDINNLVKDQPPQLVKTTEDGDPVVKIYTDTHEQAFDFLNWLEEL